MLHKLYLFLQQLPRVIWKESTTRKMERVGQTTWDWWWRSAPRSLRPRPPPRPPRTAAGWYRPLPPVPLQPLPLQNRWHHLHLLPPPPPVLPPSNHLQLPYQPVSQPRCVVQVILFISYFNLYSPNGIKIRNMRKICDYAWPPNFYIIDLKKSYIYVK